MPALRRNAKGVSWGEGDMGRGMSLDLVKDFLIARPDKHDAKAINAALAKGRHVLFTPGIFHVTEPLRVTKPGTILLGIGEATSYLPFAMSSLSVLKIPLALPVSIRLSQVYTAL